MSNLNIDKKSTKIFLSLHAVAQKIYKANWIKFPLVNDWTKECERTLKEKKRRRNWRQNLKAKHRGFRQNGPQNILYNRFFPQLSQQPNFFLIKSNRIFTTPKIIGNTEFETTLISCFEFSQQANKGLVLPNQIIINHNHKPEHLNSIWSPFSFPRFCNTKAKYRIS